MPFVAGRGYGRRALKIYHEDGVKLRGVTALGGLAALNGRKVGLDGRVVHLQLSLDQSHGLRRPGLSLEVAQIRVRGVRADIDLRPHACRVDGIAIAAVDQCKVVTKGVERRGL